MTEMMDFFKKTGAAGGRKRAAKMTPEERSASAQKASIARWKNARAKKATVASAKVRSAKAKAKRKTL